MIKITIEIRETNGSVQAKGYATPMHATQTAKEHQMTQWFMREFDKLMTNGGATVVEKEDRN